MKLVLKSSTKTKPQHNFICLSGNNPPKCLLVKNILLPFTNSSAKKILFPLVNCLIFLELYKFSIHCSH